MLARIFAILMVICLLATFASAEIDAIKQLKASIDTVTVTIAAGSTSGTSSRSKFVEKILGWLPDNYGNPAIAVSDNATIVKATVNNNGTITAWVAQAPLGTLTYKFTVLK
jgi:hypothetical protein